MRNECTYHQNMSKKQENLPAFDPSRPYNALPKLPPKADIETKAIMRECVAASRALAELKQACGLVPNADVIINTIPLREARDSSAIENIITTNDDISICSSSSHLAHANLISPICLEREHHTLSDVLGLMANGGKSETGR